MTGLWGKATGSSSFFIQPSHRKEETMEEKRKCIRFQAPFCVQFTDHSSVNPCQGVIKDISMGGVRLLLDTDSAIRPAASCAIDFFLPGKSVKVNGNVVWCRDHSSRREVGLCFRFASDSVKQEIYENIFKVFPREFTSRWWKM
ncbi:MAG: hypothetical protein GF333_03660 [Candidatus Omnitrophica bacterium]|nr:hypothetical protein [Candidatus Omnitrophota bacterium]